MQLAQPADFLLAQLHGRRHTGVQEGLFGALETETDVKCLRDRLDGAL